jgi:hypothetical protein
MEYKITIEKREPNPEYKPPKNISDVYSQRYDIPQFIHEKQLDTVLTEEEFKAIKKAVLEIM